jgi:hypothetical protein
MKRLKIPRIPSRIPLPDLPNIRSRSSKKDSDAKNDAVLTTPVEGITQDAQPVEQMQEVDKAENRKTSTSKIPLPSISKPSLRKPSVPKIPLPSISKPSAPKLSVPKIPLPSVAIPSRSKKSSVEGEVAQPKISESAVPAASSPAPAATTAAGAPEQPGEKVKPAGGLHKKISMPKMPSMHKTKEKQITEQPAYVPASSPAPAATTAAGAPEQKGAKAKPAGGLNKKISMPKLTKPGMPSKPRSKGGSKAAGRRVLALTVEGTDVRLLSYHNNSVESWKNVTFDARLLKMGQVADPEGLGESIKNAIAGIETNKSYVVCALPGLRSVSRIITIPNVNKKEMDSIIPREVRRTMTVSEEDNYFHWQVLPTEGAQTRVFVLAVPKEPLSLLLRAFSHAGLNPSQVDLKPLALMRAINQKDAVIANCEGNSMELVIVSDDIPVLIRSVFLGEGVANQDYAVGRISDELGRTIVTYNEINKEHPLDQNTPVYLTGAAAAGVPFALNVAALTGRTVQPLESPIAVPADFPIADYMVNIGLILKVV